MLSIYKDNPGYFAFEGQPTFLTGVSYLNVFYDGAIDFRTQNEKLAEIGATCNRVVSFRGEHLQERSPLLPWARKGEGKACRFDLENFDDAYWQRVRTYVRSCLGRRISLNFEVFDATSLSQSSDAYWTAHPFNPANNVNLVEADLPGNSQAGAIHQFYLSVPDQANNLKVLEYQEGWVAKLLAETVPFGNCIYNLAGQYLPGTKVSPEAKAREFSWNKYWTEFAAEYGQERDLSILCAVKPCPGLDNADRTAYLTHPRVACIDIANLIAGADAQGIARECRAWRELMQQHNLAKPVYVSALSHQEEPRYLWIPFLSGLAGACLGEPEEGGFEPYYRLVSNLVNFIKNMWFWQMKPELEFASSDQAYCLVNPGKEYVIYVIGGGRLKLDLSQAVGEFLLEWYDPRLGFYCHEGRLTGGKEVTLEVPFELRTDAVLHLEKLPG